jgi:hypothetical protein
MASPVISTNRFLRIFLVCWLVWTAIHILILSFFDLQWQIGLTDGIVFNLILALCCLFIGYVMQFYLPRKDKYWYVIAVSSLSSGITVITGNLIMHLVYRDHPVYNNFLSDAWPVRGGIAFLLSACMALISVVYYTVEEQKESEQRKHDAEKFSREAELFNLRQQLQPHFLFNSLNSISALAGNRPEEARNMIQQLSDFLRSTVRKEGQFNTVEEECHHLQLYLEIEKVRFGHRLDTSINCSDAVKQFKIPALLLQPVVENAIKFGLYDTLEPVTIKIDAFREGDMLVVRVVNPFDEKSVSLGTENLSKQGTGFGLNSIRRRLYLLFSRNDLLQTESKDQLFTTTVKIPQL